MVCFAFPYDAQNTAAMDSALTLLQRIADRGNTNIGSRYQLLARVRSMIHIPAVTLAGNETPNATVAGTGLYGQTDAEFPRVDNAALGQMSYDTTADLGLWEEGFMNQDINAEFDLTQWTGAAMTDWENNST
jgi:proline utilization trans-activator